MPAHERAMGRVTGQPVRMRSFEVRERPRSGFVSRTGTKCLESGVEELPLELFHFAVLHNSLAQRVQIVTSNDPIEVLLGEVGENTWKRGNRGRLKGHCAKQVVRTAVPAGFVDRQDLDNRKPLPSSPGNQFLKRFGITNPQISLATHSEDRSKDTRDLVLGIELKHMRVLPRQGPPDNRELGGGTGLAKANRLRRQLERET